MVFKSTFTFTIPSIHDDTVLQCRIYSPPHSVMNSNEPKWVPRAAIVAHPYAPMGGSYDDNTVLTITEVLLKEQFIVATFNFRGAGCEGRTSWQGKGELNDYISIIGFLLYYVGSLDCLVLQLQDVTNNNSKANLGSHPDQTQDDSTHGSTAVMHLVLAGYSYGSLIASRLPPTESILQQFQTISTGTAKAEIRLRAVTLAGQWNQDAELYRKMQEAKRSPTHRKLRPSAYVLAVSIGGDGSEAGSRRASHESRRSFDTLRRSVDRSKQKLGLRQDNHPSDDPSADDEGPLDLPLLPVSQTSYLLISPLLPPLSIFAARSLHSGTMGDYEKHLVGNPTLVIYGDSDFFTSQRKLRRWTEDLKARPRSLFQFCEVDGADHFWREASEKQLRNIVQAWTQSMFRDQT